MKDFDKINYPTNKIKFYPVKDNQYLNNLNQDNISINEDGFFGTQLTVNHQQNQFHQKISLIIALDISQSMKGRKLFHAKSIITNLTEKLCKDSSEIAIILFNDNNLINQDFTSDSDMVKENLEKVTCFGSTDFDYCFNKGYSSVKSLLNSAKFQKVVLVINDGVGSGNELNILDFCNQNDFDFYNISLSSNIPSLLKKIVEIKNGDSFDNIDKNQEVNQLNEIIPFVLRGNTGYDLSWHSNNCYQNRNCLIGIKDNNIFSLTHYELSNEELTRYIISEKSYNFGLVASSSSKNHFFNIKPKNEPFKITKIITPTNFNVVGISENQIISSETQFEIVFNPQDTNYIISKIILETDACNKIEITCSGGSEYSKVNLKTIKLLNPNGGEHFFNGKKVKLEWEGVTERDSILIEYSVNNGFSWNKIVNINGLNYEWIIPDNTVSDSCLIRISQISKVKNYDKIKQIKGYSKSILKAFWLNNDNEIAIASRDGFLRIWDVNTVEVIQTVINDFSNLKDVIISPDKKYFGIISDTSSVVSIFQKNGTKVLDLVSNGATLTQIDWNPTGNIISAGTNDGKLIFWEYPNINPTKVINSFNSNVTELTWNDGGDLLIAASNNGDVLTYNLNYSQVSNFKSSDLRINSIGWNKSGSVVGISSDLEYIKIWDVLTQNNTLSIVNDKKPVYKISWDPALKYILSATSDNLIKFWNPADGNFINSFDLHHGIISEISWSSNGQRICSGTENGEVFIWNLSDFPFITNTRQSDISDSVFSISQLKYELKPVNFGTIKNQNTAELNLEPFFRNLNKSNVKIDSVIIVGDTKSVFDIKNNKFDLNIFPNDSLNLIFTFKTLQNGFYNDSIFVYTDFGLLKTIISANLEIPLVKIQNTELNFGDILLDDSSDIKTIKINNLSNQNIQINSLEFIDKYNELKYINSSDNLLEIGQNELQFKVFGKKYGKSSWLAKLIFNNNQDSSYIYLSANIVAPFYKLPNKIDIKNIICSSDRIKTIELKNSGNGKLKISKIYNQNNNLSYSLSKNEIFPNDTFQIIINTNKLDKGLTKDSLFIESNKLINLNKTVQSEITFHKDSTGLKLSDSTLIFFNLDLNTAYTKEIYVINNGTKEIKLDYPIDLTYFTIEDIQPDIINIGEEAIVKVKFKGSNQTGIFSDNYTFYDLCQNPYPIELYAFLGTSNAEITTISTLDFGSIHCADEAIQKAISIKNSGTSPLQIEKIELTDNINFKIIGSSDNEILKPDKSKDFNFLFTPSKIGKFNSQIIIYSNAKNGIDGKTIINIEGSLESFNISISEDSLFFDVYEGVEQKKSISIKNNGTLDFDLKDYLLSQNFRIDNLAKTLLKPNDSLSFDIFFKGGIKDSIYIGIFKIKDSCQKNYNLYLSANVKPFPSAGIKIDSVHASSGDTISIPVRIYSIDNKKLPEVDSYLISLEFEPTILVPYKSNYQTEIKDGKRFISNLEFSSNFAKDSILGYIDLIATLGDTISTNIVISNVSAKDKPNINFEKKNGYFKLDSVCIIGGNRLFQFTGTLKLYQNEPNPAKDLTSIKIETIENGTHYLKIYDIYGYEIKSYPLLNNPGLNIIDINTNEFAQGSYFYILESPNQIRIKKMIIVK